MSKRDGHLDSQAGDALQPGKNDFKYVFTSVCKDWIRLIQVSQVTFDKTPGSDYRFWKRLGMLGTSCCSALNSLLIKTFVR